MGNITVKLVKQNVDCHDNCKLRLLNTCCTYVKIQCIKI